MPKHRKDSSDSSSDSGPDDRHPPPKKSKHSKPSKSSKRDDSDSDDGKSYTIDKEGFRQWDLGQKRFLKVRKFKGKTYIDVREFYEKDGELLPGKKGISMTTEQWHKLTTFVSDVRDAIEVA